MSIQSEIDRIEQNIANTYTALSELGADMPTPKNSDNLAQTVGTAKAVLYIEQTLTEEQQTQARRNIGAPSSKSIPDVPSWALEPQKPSYTKSEVGLGNVDNVKQYSASNPPPYPVTKVNGKTGAVSLSAADVGAVPATSIVQETGNSTSELMSQAVVSKELNQLSNEKADKDAVFDLTRNPLFTNVFDSVAVEYGKLLNSDGTVSDTTARLATTDFIYVKTGDVIRMADFALYSTGTPKIGVYNASKGLYTTATAASIKTGSYYLTSPDVDANGDIIGFTIDHLAKGGYIRICTSTSVVGNNPILTINEEIEYEDGYGFKLNGNVKVDYSQLINAPGQNGWSILPYEHLNICYSSINRKPINTVEHFTDAAENFGYNSLKCDVRPTSDGELVCCHDAGFTFDSSGYITTYDSNNQTLIHNVTAATVLGYSFPNGEHPCLVGDFLDVCRKYGKIAFVTIRNEYMDVVIPKLLEELKIHNMTYASIINCMTYESLVQWRAADKAVMINYTLNYGVAIDQTQIDRAVGLGYCSLCGFSLSSSSLTPSASCDFEYARENGIRLLEAIAYKEGSPEACYDLGYDGCQIGIPWNPKTSGGTVDTYTKAEIDSMFGSYVNDINTLLGGD